MVSAHRVSNILAAADLLMHIEAPESFATSLQVYSVALKNAALRGDNNLLKTAFVVKGRLREIVETNRDVWKVGDALNGILYLLYE